VHVTLVKCRALLEFALTELFEVGLAVEEAAEDSTVGWVNWIRKVGDEKVNPYAAMRIQPSFSLTTVVAIFASPDSEITEIFADIGAFENP
jgi:hypothetical protein